MGLVLQVGILADLEGADAEGCEDFAGAFARLRSYLASLGLPPHEEPRGGDTWSAQMLGYSGLHHVRRIAAYLDCGRPLPKPAAKDDPDEARELLVAQVMNPGKRLTQIWHEIERTDVANFNPALARSLAFTTERMTVAESCALLVKSANLG
jgi:hypothetical protein